MAAWREALLEEIASNRVVSSRGKLNPRGVRRKMSTYNLRHRGGPLNRRHQPVVVLSIHI
jgi:hypothetical protein